jgi:hypothetical protein
MSSENARTRRRRHAHGVALAMKFEDRLAAVGVLGDVLDDRGGVLDQGLANDSFARRERRGDRKGVAKIAGQIRLRSYVTL